MIRRFNYTGRIKIPRSRADISLESSRDGKTFQAALDFDGLKLMPSAKVYIEAYYKGVYQRFDFGSVGHIITPATTLLDQLPNTEVAYFDVIIVDESGVNGMILGAAKGIMATADGLPRDRQPLLPVNPTDLINQFWKVSFDSNEDGRPILEINRNIPDIFEKARTDISFISLVYPAAFRIVLYKLLGEGDFEAEEGSWVRDWVKFIAVVLGIKNFPKLDEEDSIITDEQETWIDDCVNEYCKKMNLFDKFCGL